MHSSSSGKVLVRGTEEGWRYCSEHDRCDDRCDDIVIL